MGTKVVGKLDDWSDADVGGNDFMNLEEGSNVVRIVTSPYQFYVAWTQDATGQNRKVRSAVENCPLVKRGDKVQPRWYVGVLNRKTNTPAILELGPQIFKQIVALRKRDKWGDPRTFDLNIEKQPKGSQPLYVVMPEPKEPLTSEEKATVKAFVDRIDLAKMTEAPTPEDVLKQLGLSAATVASSPAKSTASAPAASSNDDDDFNFDDV